MSQLPYQLKLLNLPTFIKIFLQVYQYFMFIAHSSIYDKSIHFAESAIQLFKADHSVIDKSFRL